MLNLDLVRKIGTPEEYIPLILDYDQNYGSQIEQIAAEYILTCPLPACVPYKDDGERTASYMRCREFVARATALSEVPQEQAMLAYLFWLHCLPYAWRFYTLLGIDETIFFDSLRDITYKLRECLQVRGYPGVFVDWFFLFFDMKLFALGRFQYELAKFPYDRYSSGGYAINKGDTVYSIHIPSCGPLTQESIWNSFRKAYAFFKKELPGTVLPVVTHTWLLYPPYQGVVFPENSNIRQFSNLFHVVQVHPTEQFWDCWRVFNKDYTGSTADLPADTGLQRRFIDYIGSGGTFGNAYGVLLYDGEKDILLGC